MIVDPQRVPEGARSSSLPVTVFLSEAVSLGVLGAKVVFLSSLCPPHHANNIVGTRPASDGWFQKLQSSGDKGALVAAEGDRFSVLLPPSLGQGSFTRVRNCFAITHVPCQAVSSSLHTLTPHPGIVFPAKSPDRTWPGASLSEAAMPRRAL